MSISYHLDVDFLSPYRCGSLQFGTDGVLISMFPSRSDKADPTESTSLSVGSGDSSRTIQSYARLALAALLTWLAYSAFHDADGYVPLLGDIDLAIHEFGHMLFMPFGIPFLGRT